MTACFPVFYSALFEAHNTGPGHPENAGRLKAIVRYLDDCKNDADSANSWIHKLSWRTPSNRDVLPDVLGVHDAAYVNLLRQVAAGGGGALDADTVMSDRSYDAALLAVAAWLDGVDWVRSHRQPGFALVRPPGHHAERDRAMGFCLLSNAAIAAHYAVSDGASRVAILDWDVHHGNGTEALIASNSQIVYCSLHQSPAYPGTGLTSSAGVHQNVLNVPLPPGSAMAQYQSAWEAKVAPFLQDFHPDLLLVSAGYDATLADPLAQMSLSPEDYAWFTRECLEITPATLFGLEGGYDYTALAAAVAETMKAACDHVSA